MGRTIRRSGTIAGVIVHAFGVWDRRRPEAETSTYGASLVTALYWVCWLLLAGVLLYLMV